MRKKITLLIASLAFLLGSSDNIWGQQGVLLPKHQGDGATCACGLDHGDDELHIQESSSQATPEKWPHYPSKRSALTNQVAPRRGQISNPLADPHKRDTIHGKGDVNLVFGAGESSVISSGSVNWPGTGGGLYSNSIFVGSDYAKNAVIAIADLNGLATGALRDLRFYQQGHGNKAGTQEPDTIKKQTFNASVAYCGPTNGTYGRTTTPGQAQLTSNQLAQYRATLSYNPAKDPLIQRFSGSSISPTLGTDPYGGLQEIKNRISQTAWNNANNQYLIEAAGSAGAYYWPYKNQNKHEYYVSIYNAHKPGWANWNAFTFYGATSDTLYTSTKDATAHDDGQPLLYALTGEYGVTLNDGHYDAKLGAAHYHRPTTVLLSGQNTLDAITIGNVEWYAAYMQGAIWNTIDTLFHALDPAGCCHYSGWVSYYRDDARFDTIRTERANRYVDAAVRLLDGADVCVRGHVKDNTASPYSIGAVGDNITDAFLVLPGANGGTGRSNFRIKIGGNANMLHTQDKGAYAVSNPLMDNYLYSDAGGGPGSLFPRAQSPIWLSGGGVSPILYNDEVSGLNWSGYGTLTDNTNVDKTKWRPYASTKASVYGVGGLYNGGTDIHTRTIDGNDTTSIIQIGSTTNNQHHFKIYSGGMLKNFRSAYIGACDSLVIGRNNVAPSFYLSNNTMPLYIINDGDGTVTGCCDAGIRFHTPGVNSLNNAIANATGGGDLHIQAHSYVNIYDNINFITTRDNNVATLSDAAYLNTKGFTYTGGTGNLTLWAQGMPTDQSGCGGYILMGGAVNVTNTGTKADGPVLTTLVPVGNANIAKYPGCTDVNTPAAYAKLDTRVQTRIQSNNDAVSITGLYTHTNPNAGALLVQGNRKVDFYQGGTFTLTGGTSDVAIQSKNADVAFGNLFTYDGGITTDLFIDGETGITFSGGSITQPATATHVNAGIQSDNGTILFKGAPFAFDVTNTDNVQVWAGKNIDVRHTLTYDDKAGTATHVHFFANDSLLTNAHWGGAPVTFTVGNTNATNTLTDWIAGGNIHTRDRVTFNYGSTGNQVRDLTLKSLGGNIAMDRPVNITYDSENTVLLSAEIPCAEKNTPNAGNNASGTGGNRNIHNGNILLNDSLRILRTNITPGLTDLFAKYNIRTAMVTMDDQASTGNSTTVKSYMGDIFLGYSAMADGKTTPAQSNVSYDLNRFVYTANAANVNGLLKVHAGFDDQTNTNRDGGGNIYFTHIDATMAKTGNHPAEIKIPYSNEYFCGSAWSGGMLHERLNPSFPNAMSHYEHAGIIGGVGRCGTDAKWAQYAPSVGPGTGATDTSLIYRANNGRLLVDAGTRGNIIMNRGTYMDFQNDKANAFFLTRYGDIDMRYPTNVDNLMGSVLFLANNELPGKLNVTPCGCDEQRNNVYLQDFQFRIDNGEGSVFIGADNNIKLQYGGLRNIGTQRDPFLSEDAQYPCGSGKYHCDSDTAANKARELILDFNKATTSGNGGFAAVSSDLIDVYKNLVYNGGASGKGMSTVPTYGSLHGESVAGYGLYIKTQANKKNWNKTDHELNSNPNPLIGAACEDDTCTASYLHNTARVTFHADARLHAENQKVLVASPVLETFGNLELNTHLNKGAKTSILIQTDSLICHDSLIIDGPKTQFTTWSNLQRDMPIIRLGHQRFTPPTAETGCKPCYVHTKGANGLDTVFVTFRNDASVKRLHTLVAEHAVISFLTDSFDHKRGNPTINAKFYTDIFKIRNHVELFNTPDHTRDGHFELISEEQMQSKDYAGIYSRQLHMEPIAPTCSNFGYSQLWLQDPALDVITSATFGGFGWLHADVHVEIEGNLFPGYASLQHDGNCYEQKAGILKVKDLRLDKGAYLKFSVGDKASPFVETYDCLKTSESINIGQYADCLDVDSLTIYGSVNLDMVIRPEGLVLNPGESRCFPVIRYKSVQEGVLNHLKMKKFELTSKDHKSIDGKYYLTLDVDTACNIVYICIATVPNPVILRPINIPTVPGVTVVSPTPGTHYVKSSGNFKFTLKFDTEPPLKVLTGRIINGKPEEIFGTKNANGEYVYTLSYITGPIQLAIGPDFASMNPNANEAIDGTLVWSHNNTLYIKVDREDVASIYSVAGQLVKQIELSGGETSAIPMERGVYIVTLNDGSVHKVIIK